MGKRGPKPKPESELRRHAITCRVTDIELEKIDSARPAGISRGEWIRTSALKRRLPRPIPEINLKVWADLARALANLNQLAKAANVGFCNVDTQLLNEIKELIKKLRLELLGERKSH